VLVVSETSETIEQRSRPSVGVCGHEEACPPAHSVRGVAGQAFHFWRVEVIGQCRPNTRHAFQDAEILSVGDPRAQLIACLGKSGPQQDRVV